jgi:hypothetical protein
LEQFDLSKDFAEDFQLGMAVNYEEVEKNKVGMIQLVEETESIE